MPIVPGECGSIGRLNCEIHVWHFAAETLLGLDERWLDAEERARAARFTDERAARRYVWFHAAMRLVLARYCGLAPDAVVYGRAANGKPVLACSGPQFNLSHTSDYAVLAVTAEPVGVDIESVRAFRDLDTMSRQVMSDNELSHFERIDKTRRKAVFLSCWTRKEALLKAVGTGLAQEPATITVGWGAQDVALNGETWHLMRLRGLPAGMLGSVACRREAKLRQMSLYSG